MSDRVNFDQAASFLGISTEELQGMVSNQEIRAEHDGGEVFFLEEDLDAYQKSRSTEPTVENPKFREFGKTDFSVN